MAAYCFDDDDDDVIEYTDDDDGYEYEFIEEEGGGREEAASGYSSWRPPPECQECRCSYHAKGRPTTTRAFLRRVIARRHRAQNSHSPAAARLWNAVSDHEMESEAYWPVVYHRIPAKKNSG